MSDAVPFDPDNAGPGQADARPPDARPTYRVGVFGLGQKFQRIAEIILRHARHNRYRYVLAVGPAAPAEFDIAMVDMTALGGPEVARTLRAARPVVRVGRRCDTARGQDDLLQSGFTMKLLETLNRVVEDVLLGRPPDGDEQQAGLVDEGGMSRRARVLIVDDSPTVRRQLMMALQRMGIESDGAGSAAQARSALADRRYDLAFVDVMMPDLDGFKFTRELKRHSSLRAMPVVILTSRSSPLDLARGALAGCNSYLVKPVTLQSLRETLARHIRLNARIALERAGLRPT